MRLAIAEASKAAAEGNAPIGAIITKNNRVVAHGHNEVFTKHDVAAHAEIVTIRNLTRRAQRFDLEGHILYSTFEPCGMCLIAALRTKISRVVYGAKSEDAPQFSSGILKRANSRVYEIAGKRTELVSGVLREHCKKLLAEAVPD